MKKYCNCKNVKNKKYHGGENTPLGNGFHASGYEEGKRKRGTKGDLYFVKKDKNGYKRWVKHTTSRGNMGLYPPISK